VIRGTTDFAPHLLGSLGCRASPSATTSRHPTLAWAASGAVALTGPADGAPLLGNSLPAEPALCEVLVKRRDPRALRTNEAKFLAQTMRDALR